ncbi:uncharacterized protein LOC107761208 [Nicotiana tabacum]|uniref:uncharacterized protein LOC107761208 n=1 Tax=Nicotiana tabacum TaxID=4097 RepID=UPI003F4E9B4A
MEFFEKAKSVRLKSHHGKFLHANSNQQTVHQHRHGTSKTAKWTVEFPEGINNNVVRLNSCYGKYLMATDEQFLLGVTGLKVVQSLPKNLDSSIEWEPVKVGSLVKLKTRYGKFLRANSGLPPFRNSITHDIPYRHQDWILWEVDIVELLPDVTIITTIPHFQASKELLSEPKPELLDGDLSSSFRLTFSRSSKIHNQSKFDAAMTKPEGRLIYYYVADEKGTVNDAVKGPSFQFKGQGLEELTQKLEEETGLKNITLCLRNKINGNLCPLKLELPPNNATMHVVVVPSSSKARE